ncbi:MAG: hypothetical protein KG075_07640 [Alphaproteobacteria bacterium]|nr:hypothetical protein [Alphaproteobacteria bacterium]
MNFHSLLPGGCSKHRIKRSVILDASASANAAITFAGNGNRKTFTRAFAVKRCKLGVRQELLAAGPGNTAAIYFNSSDQLVVRVGNLDSVSTQVFRDTTGFYLFCVAVDMTQATASLRLVASVGAALISWGTYSVPAQNTDDTWNSAVAHSIGSTTAAGGNFSDVVLAEVYNVPGLALDYTSFYQADPRSGSLRPIKYATPVATNAFYLPFVGDAGDAPATAAEGFKDRSGNGNHWTPANISVADFVKDTPTNFRSGSDYRGNFATLSPIGRTGSASFGICPLAAGGLKASPTSALSALATVALPKSGKRYWEIEFNAGGFPVHGIANRTFLGGGNATGTFGWYGNGGNGAIHHLGTTSGADANAPNTVGDIALHYVDIDANKYWIGRRRAGVTTWMGGGDPVAGTNPTFSGSGGGGVYSTALNLQSGKWWPQVSGGGSWTAIANFGQRTFANTPPAGALTLNAAANPKPANLKLSNAYVQAFNSGANVLTELSTRRSAWGNSYVDIIKNYAAEGWRWRFGDDSAYFLDSADQANGKLAFPALGAGAAYFAHSLRVGAVYGVATGQVVHVNGAPTVVNDNLNTARRAILLFRADAGGPHPIYHPDLTPGSLLYLNGNAAEAAATDITSIGANSFAVGSGMPSGTYRWISLADGYGHISLGLFDGNSSADGPTNETEGEPAFLHVKCKNGVDPARTYANRGINPENRMVNLGTTAAEDNASTINVDFLANGFKLRGTDSGLNSSGRSYVYIAFNKVNFAPGECAAQGTAR